MTTMSNQYTELEQKVIDCIIDLHNEGDYHFADEILDWLGNEKSIRGALGSLVKKGIIDINRDDEDSGLLSVFDSSIRAQCGLAQFAS
tara:strand:- start:307 stop:570 length:264 start_codon:yes stop_codon:yes gene_type:complete